MIFIDKKEELPLDIPDSLIEKTVIIAIEQQGAVLANLDLTIVLTDDQQLKDLNNEWMGIDAPTDVLSFPSDEIDPDTGNRYLGDIVISIQRAKLQADTAGHPVESEVQLLTAHGILHLFGHDHAEAEEKTRMWAAQADILGRLGLGGLEIRE
ncbi:MAG: rRNA maturation RNase YbeY [Chloroflexota bacterium]